MGGNGGRLLTAGRLRNTVVPMPVMSFKVSAADARAIRARAKARRKTVSAYLREQALVQKPRRRRPSNALHPLSGLTFDATPGREVTDEEVRAALSDFP
jgi:hypothetical protein